MNDLERRFPAPPLDQRLKVNESWLLRLRWVAVFGQLVTIGVAAAVLRVQLPLVPLLTIIGVTAATNLLFAGWLRGRSQRVDEQLRQDHYVLGGLMLLDLLALTALLFLTGGPTNPFTVFYFVNVALAAMLLPSRWAWALLGVAVGCLSVLFVEHRPLPELNRAISTGALPLTLEQLGFAVAVAVCAGVVAYFITRVTRELQQRERELRVAEQQRARSERLEALATLAAGAGHELASPLSTIAVIAKDLAKHLEGAEVPPSVLEDLALIRSELDHCRTILDGLSSSAGEASGEAMQPVTVAQMVAEIVHGIRRRQRVQVQMEPELGERRLIVPLVAVAQAIRGVVRNALDASRPDQTVMLDVSAEGNRIHFVVLDQGTGMSPEVLERAVEPFFTTKETGKGMGMGLFLTRNMVNRLGGKFELDSVPGQGTRATIELPLEEEAEAVNENSRSRQTH